MQKKYDIFWEFFPNGGPPPPTPFENPLVENFFGGLFCILGHKEHFWFSPKSSYFVTILTFTFGDMSHHADQMSQRSQVSRVTL